jgi:hypothetical protein
MDIGAAGNLIIFFSLFVALVLVGLLVGSYAAYSFLLTLTNTAAGNDEVLWPGDPITDWLFKICYLGWLLALWAVPASLVLAVMQLPPPLTALCLAALLWLIFPASLLSSLSAHSQFVVLRPTIIHLLFRHFGATVRFYASSGLVVLVCAALGYAAVFGFGGAHAYDQPVLLVPLAAGAGAVGWLLYARLLGRMALLISRPDSGKRTARERKPSSYVPPVETFDPWSLPDEKARGHEKPRPHRQEPDRPLAEQKRMRPQKQSRAHDPWAVPAEEPIRKTMKPTSPTAPVPEDPYGPAEGTYELTPEGAPLPPEPLSRRSVFEEEEPEPYAVSASAPPSKLPPPVLTEVSKREEELAAPRRPPAIPDRPFLTGVYSFPFYPQTVGACGTLALGFLGVLGLARALLASFPF